MEEDIIETQYAALIHNIFYIIPTIYLTILHFTLIFEPGAFFLSNEPPYKMKRPPCS
jgi:hypothetical protein